MKKTLLMSALIASVTLTGTANAKIFSDDVMSSGYNSFGIERFDFKTTASRDGSLGEANMLSFNRGYKLNDYFFVEGGLSVPIGNKLLSEYENTFCVYNNQTGCEAGSYETEVYRTEIKPSVVADLGFRFELPIHKNLTAFATVGYSYTRITHSGYYAVDNVTQEKYYNLIDVPPAPEMVDSASASCLVDGGAGKSGDGSYMGRIACDEVFGFNNKYGAKGGTYGLGLSFNFTPDASFVFEYRKYSHDNGALEPTGLSVSYQWRF